MDRRVLLIFAGLLFGGAAIWSLKGEKDAKKAPPENVVLGAKEKIEGGTGEVIKEPEPTPGAIEITPVKDAA